MDATQSELDAANRQASHSSLSGRMYGPGGQLLTTGLLSIPDSDLNVFRKEIAENPEAPLALHERQSDPAPFYCDTDMRVDCDWKLFHLANALIEDANLDVRAIGACPSLQADLKMVDLRFEHTAEKLGMHIFDWLKKDRVKPPGQDDVFATWSEIIALGCDDAKFQSSIGTELLRPTVLRPVVALMLMALGRIVQRTVHEFYPGIAPDSLQLQTIVLANHLKTDNTSILSVEKDSEHKMKIGAHIYMRMLLMDRNTALYVWQALVDYCTSNFKVIPSKELPNAFWHHVFDASPYLSSTGGLRMPYSLKAVECSYCKTKKKVKCKEEKPCVCKNTGKITEQRFYGPLCLLNGTGAVDLSENTFLQLHNRAWILTMCVVRVPPTNPTPGLVDLKTKTAPANILSLERANLEKHQGSAKAKRTMAQLAHATGVAPDRPEMGHLLSSLNIANEVLGTSRSFREVMPTADTRYAKIEEALPLLCAALFHKCYADMKVRAVSVNKVDGHVSSIIVFVQGPAASRCFNRMFDVNDSVIQGDRPDVEIRGDVDGVPGRHTNWNCTVYFVIDRRHGGTITQKCCNKQSKQNRRSARASGIGHMAQCSMWKGYEMAVGEKYRDVVRSMLFDEREQTNEACRKMVLDEATKLFRLYRGVTTVSELGPTDEYQAYASKALKVSSGKKRRLTEEHLLDNAPSAVPSPRTSETSVDLHM